MSRCKISSTLLALVVPFLAATAALGAGPEPCSVVSAETWGGIMGYKATATPGDMVCTFEGPAKTGGGQFRIMAIVGSSAEAEASAKRMRDRHPKNGRNASLAAIDSGGSIVFSIALFQHEATDSTPAQLQKLVAAAKKQLSK